MYKLLYSDKLICKKIDLDRGMFIMVGARESLLRTYWSSSRKENTIITIPKSRRKRRDSFSILHLFFIKKMPLNIWYYAELHTLLEFDLKNIQFRITKCDKN